MSGPAPALALYRALTLGAEPLLPLLLAVRRRRGKEDPARLGERLGRPGLPRPAGPLAWLHGASVGEVGLLLPLVGALLARGVTPLVTAGTLNAARFAAARLPAGALHQFAPLDGPRAAARFLDHWRPDLGLVAESELWPNLLLAAAARGVPLALVNARLSERSAAGWARAPGSAARLARLFALVLARSEEDAARWRALGAAGAVGVGDLKLDAAPLPVDAGALAALRAAIGARPAWAAASTHPGEEAVAARAHRRLLAARPDALLVLAPRHPERAGEALAALAAEGIAASRHSLGEAPGPGHGAHLVDAIGALGLVYRAAGAAFVGGSLVPRGGQNPAEAARLGAAVLHGPLVANFRGLYDALGRAGGAREVADEAALAAAVAALWDDPARATDQRAAAEAALDALGGALARTLEALAPLLDRIAPPGAPAAPPSP